MYYYGATPSCGSQTPYYYPFNNYKTTNNTNYAIILVLFILLVIVLGARFTNN